MVQIKWRSRQKYRNDEQIIKIVLDNRRLKMHELPDVAGVSKSEVYRKMAAILDKRKLCKVSAVIVQNIPKTTL